MNIAVFLLMGNIIDLAYFECIIIVGARGSGFSTFETVKSLDIYRKPMSNLQRMSAKKKKRKFHAKSGIIGKNHFRTIDAQGN